MIPGIDLAGVVETSSTAQWASGESVLVTGWGMGEDHYGGFAQMARVPAAWPVRIPVGMDAAGVMAAGTAGFTAMPCLFALKRHGAKPGDGPVLVTGAAGGVGSWPGSIAISLLAKNGWQVIASTGRPNETEYLRGLGAADIIDRARLSSPGKPMGKERWAAAVDSVGSHTFANVLAQTKRGGAAAACGLAQGMDPPASVAPFILRNVALLGVDSVMCPPPLRIQAWEQLARDLDQEHLVSLTQTIEIEDVIATASRLLAGEIRGRIVIRL